MGKRFLISVGIALRLHHGTGPVDFAKCSEAELYHNQDDKAVLIVILAREFKPPWAPLSENAGIAPSDMAI